MKRNDEFFHFYLFKVYLFIWLFGYFPRNKPLGQAFFFTVVEWVLGSTSDFNSK